MKNNSFSLTLAVLLFALSLVTFASDAYKPKKGDVISISFDPPPPAGDFVKALTASEITHCGIVAKKNGEFLVIESWGAGCMETPLVEFLARSPRYIVARLDNGTPQRGKIIKDAIEKARTHLGEPYDFAWQLNNGLVYCSELIYEAFGVHSGVVPIPVGSLHYQGWEWFLPLIGLTLETEVITPVSLVTAEGWTVVYDTGDLQ